MAFQLIFSFSRLLTSAKMVALFLLRPVSILKNGLIFSTEIVEMLFKTAQLWLQLCGNVLCDD